MIYGVFRDLSHRQPDAALVCAPDCLPISCRSAFFYTEYVNEILRSSGIGHRDRVAMVLPDGPETAMGSLAIAASAAAAPLNPAYTAKEFAFYLADLNPRLLVVRAGVDSPARNVAQELSIPIAEMHERVPGGPGLFPIEFQSGSSSARSESSYSHSDDIALLLHTSGTTSRPKLVPLSQDNICKSAGNTAASLRLTSEDRCLSVMPLFHVHGLIAAVLSAAYSGGSVVCPREFDASQFFQWLQAFAVTWYTAGPTIHEAILAESAHVSAVPERCRLRVIRSATTAMALKSIARLERVFRVPVIETYGMTEGAAQITSNPLPPATRKAGSVGRAAGPEVAIVDDAGQAMLANQSGEIVIRGDNVMRGYLGNPKANRDAFTDGWLRTGDQGHLDPQGYLYITGRIKELINRAGEKISPREIDEALLTHPDIVDAATFAVPHSTQFEDAAAAVVVAKGSSLSARQIRLYLNGRLARFKVPSVVVLAEVIPRSATGKIFRHQLRHVFADQLVSEFTHASTEREGVLASIWAEVLSLDRVGVDDNFFSLGGDSIRAITLINRVNQAFRGQLTLADLFTGPTIRELAEIIGGPCDR